MIRDLDLTQGSTIYINQLITITGEKNYNGFFRVGEVNIKLIKLNKFTGRYGSDGSYNLVYMLKIGLQI